MPRHRLDPVSLLAGLSFCGVGAVFLRGTDVTVWPWAVVAPAALTFVGVVALLALILRRGPRDGRS